MARRGGDGAVVTINATWASPIMKARRSGGGRSSTTARRQVPTSADQVLVVIGREADSIARRAAARSAGDVGDPTPSSPQVRLTAVRTAIRSGTRRTARRSAPDAVSRG
jgi:hypothetical protein